MEWNGIEQKEKGMKLRRNDIGMENNWKTGKEEGKEE